VTLVLISIVGLSTYH